jgi:hypothetical protein
VIAQASAIVGWTKDMRQHWGHFLRVQNENCAEYRLDEEPAHSLEEAPDRPLAIQWLAAALERMCRGTGCVMSRIGVFLYRETEAELESCEDLESHDEALHWHWDSVVTGYCFKAIIHISVRTARLHRAAPHFHLCVRVAESVCFISQLCWTYTKFRRHGKVYYLAYPPGIYGECLCSRGMTGFCVSVSGDDI